MNYLPILIICHLVGDFVLQNHWMQQKSKNSVVCFIHVLFYSIPFWIAWHFHAITAGQLLLIQIEHFCQDRWALHLKWMKFFGQTTPDLWPVGPLCMDQTFHLAFIALVLLLS